MAGAILFVRVPDTIIRSDWRGLANEGFHTFLRGTRNHTQTLEVKSGARGLEGWIYWATTHLNHFHSAASQTEGHREHGTGTAIANHLIDRGDAGVNGVIDLFWFAHGNLIGVCEIVGHLLGRRIRRVPHSDALLGEEKARLVVSREGSIDEPNRTSSQHSWMPLSPQK